MPRIDNAVSGEYHSNYGLLVLHAIFSPLQGKSFPASVSFSCPNSEKMRGCYIIWAFLLE